MKFKNGFLFLLLLTLVSGSLSAQIITNRSSRDTITSQQQADELRRIESLTATGPHYKNPNAAGRQLTFKRAAGVVAPLPAKTTLLGPAYKNKKKMTARINSTPVPTKRKLMGPRYKNKGAKAHRD